MERKYYHLFANGDDAKDFITTENEFKSAFNRFAVCSYLSGATVVSASVEDSHPHSLLWGYQHQCESFKNFYEKISRRSIVQRRGSLDGVRLNCQLYEITDNQYLKAVGTYTIVQATKDGKAVMPYDYRYGTGALYFRSRYAILPWYINDNGEICKPVEISSLTLRERRQLFPETIKLPSHWKTCNGFILPENYVDIERFEAIYGSHNCFRAFLSSGKAKDDPIREKMAQERGVIVEDLEARRICSEHCFRLFGVRTARMLSTAQRITLAQNIRNTYRLSYRQLSFLTKLPESELRKYVK